MLSKIMYGYAVRAADLGAGALRIIGEAAAGRPFDGAVGSGEAARIFTGAPVPEGADTVVIQENARAGDGTVEIVQTPAKSANIRRAGMDFREGDVLLRAGRRLAPRDLVLAAGMNHAALPVVRRPVVAILATGDELVMPGETPRPGQIISSSPSGLAPMIRRMGGEPHFLGVACDTLDSLRERLAEAQGADVLLTIGGASVGEHDLVARALREAGGMVHFQKVAMRPGKPLTFAQLGRTRVIGVPGNPVSTLICARVFLQPLVAALLGSRDETSAGAVMPLAAPLPTNAERAHYMRAETSRENGRPAVRALPDQDSSLMAALARADCLIVREPHAPAAQAGDPVTVLPLDF